MKGKIKILLFLCLAWLITGCSHKKMTISEYCKWVVSDDSGLRKNREVSDLKYSVFYLPEQYVAIKNLDPNNNRIDQVSLENELKTSSQSAHFIFQIENASQTGDVIASGVSSKEDYYQRIVYLSYYAANDFKLISDKDTLVCEMAQFEQMYNAAPYTRLSLVFGIKDTGKTNFQLDKTQDYGDMVLIYDDKVWGNGLLKFKFSGSDLNNMPELDI